MRKKKHTQHKFLKGKKKKKPDFVPPVTLAEGLKRTIEYEFVNKVEGHTFTCE